MITQIYDFFSKLGVYKYYEKILEEKISKKEIPKHIGVIMDGNRRMAEKIGSKTKTIGHKFGAKKSIEFVKWCVDLGVNTITLYSFSQENFNRPKDEVDYLMNLFKEEFIDTANSEMVHKHKIRIKAIGKLELLPDDVIEAINYAENKTKNYSNYYVNVAIAYGGQQEIVEAVKKVALKVKNGELDIEEITAKVISENLYTSHLPKPDPDLIIRTSGEERISNFLTWQSIYSELYFCDMYWPQFRKIDFLRAIRNYQQRKRKYGK